MTNVTQHTKKQKNFKDWFPVKTRINNRQKFPTFKLRDVFWCYVGENVGNEEDGKGEFYSRPAVIIKTFNSEFCLVVPLSSKIKENKYYVEFEFMGKPQSALISQIKSIDVRRLKSKMGTVSHKDFDKIITEIKKFWQN